MKRTETYSSLCNKLHTYLYHHIIVLDKYIHSSLVALNFTLLDEMNLVKTHAIFFTSTIVINDCIYFRGYVTFSLYCN